MTDTWGCDGESLFDFGLQSGFGTGTKSLTELVDGLSAKKTHTFSTDSKLPFPDATSPSENSENVQVIPCWQSHKIGNGVHAPKILKKKSSINKTNRDKSLKRVSFEIEQLIAREAAGGDKEEMKKRLVISLGGAPPKGPCMNLKELKEKRAAERIETEEQKKLQRTMDQIMGRKAKKQGKRAK